MRVVVGSTNSSPCFCPQCRRTVVAERPLCHHCGATVIAQGFCSTCEHFWPLPIGEPCPKHELPLEDAATAFESELPEGPIAWTTVRSYVNPIAAHAARLRLDAEGIPTFLAGERMGLNTLYQVATGGVKLQVPCNLLADARVLLSQSWAPPVFDDDLDDLDDIPLPVATPAIDPSEIPEPSIGQARWVMLGLILILALILVGLLVTQSSADVLGC